MQNPARRSGIHLAERQGQSVARDEAFGHKLLAAGPDLIRIAHAILGDHSLAEDAVASAYLKAWKGRRALRDEAKLSPWLRRICRNQALNLRKQRQCQQRLLAGRDPDDVAATDSSFDEARLRADLLRRLPESLKTCARMFFFEGRAYSEIAAVENLPLSTVRGRIYQARSRLRKEIDMTTKPAGPHKDEYDDGTIRAALGDVIRWRGTRVRLLGVGWVGQKRLYDVRAKRLSRTPAIVRRCEVFQGKGSARFGDDESPCMWVFWELSGNIAGYMGTGVHPPVPNVTGTVCEELDDKRLVCGWATVPAGSGQWVKVAALLVGEILRREDSCERFDFNLARSFVATSRPGWGSLCLFTARRGRQRGTSELSLAYSSPKAEDTWAVLALDKAGNELECQNMGMANSFCAEGRVAGVELTYPLPPSQLAGVVFRPRPRVRIEWGRIRIPPKPQ